MNRVKANVPRLLAGAEIVRLSPAFTKYYDRHARFPLNLPAGRLA